MFAMVKCWIALRLKLPRSEVGGVAWHPTNWAMELTSGPFFQMMKYLSPSPVVCPCHYCTEWLASWLTCKLFRWARPVSSWLAAWILTIAWFGTTLDHLGWHVEGALTMWQTGTCLKVTMDQRSCAVEGCKPVICLQAFVFAKLLDVSSDGGGVMPTPECRTCRDDDLHQAIEPFSGGFSGWGHASRFLHGLEFSIFTCLALDVDHESVLAFHKTFGGILMALCTFGPVAIARKRNMCIGDAIAFLQLEFDQRPFHCTDLLGFALDRGDSCPDAVKVLSVSGVSPADFSGLLTLDVCSDMRVTSFEGPFDDLGPFVELLRSTGLLDLMLCLGWSCVIPVSAWHDGLPRTQISLPSKVLTQTGCLEPINKLLANLFTACSCARLDPCCAVSWLTHSFLTPRTPLNREGALVLRLRSRRIPSKVGLYAHIGEWSSIHAHNVHRDSNPV